jgi:hypothetical protein
LTEAGKMNAKSDPVPALSGPVLAVAAALTLCLSLLYIVKGRRRRTVCQAGGPGLIE